MRESFRIDLTGHWELRAAIGDPPDGRFPVEAVPANLRQSIQGNLVSAGLLDNVRGPAGDRDAAWVSRRGWRLRRELELPPIEPNFHGVDDHALLGALDLHTDRATITCWLRRDGDQNDFAGLVFTRGGSSVAGLNFGTSNELRYHWNGAASSYSFDSGLVVPDDAWVFAALVVEPAGATLYLGEGGSLSSAVNPVGHGLEEFDGPLSLARDPASNARRFRGWLDDVRLHDHAFTASEIEALYLGSL